MLQILDQRWKEHLATMDHLRQGIHLRAYAQKQPKQEYKREAFELFQELLYVIKRDVIRLLSRVQIERPESCRRNRAAPSRRAGEADALHASGRSAATNGDGEPEAAEPVAQKAETFVRHERKVGRNEAVPVRLGKEIQALPRTDRLMAVNLPPLGKLASIRGIRIGTASAGIKQTQRDDLVVMSLAAGSRVAGVFTQSSFKAAPVRVCEEHLSRAAPRAILVNSGNANAATGSAGIEDALQCCRWVAEALDVSVETVLPFSTGVIGQRLPLAETARRHSEGGESHWRRVGTGRARDHDDRHRPQSVVSFDSTSAAPTSRSPVSRRAPA